MMAKDVLIQEWIFEETIKHAVINMFKGGLLSTKEITVVATRVMRDLIAELDEQEGANDE